jgi:hypothetical protein
LSQSVTSMSSVVFGTTSNDEGDGEDDGQEENDLSFRHQLRLRMTSQLLPSVQ